MQRSVDNRSPAGAQLSVVIPVFNERPGLRALLDELTAEVSDLLIPAEIIFVDDGSTDGSAEELDALAAQDPSLVRVIHLRGNFGKTAALAAGFDSAGGEIVVTLDADLQDDPREIPRFLEALDSGLDLVSGYKKNRRDPLRRVVASRIFNWLVRCATGTGLHDVNCGFKAMRRQVVAEITLYGELHRFIPILACWRKFRVGEIEVGHRARKSGKSKYGLPRYLRGFVDLLTVSFLTRFDMRPAHFFSGIGLTLFGIGFVICSYLSILWFRGGGPIGGRPLLMLGVLLLIGGVQGVCLGLLAELVMRRRLVDRRPYSVARISWQALRDRESDDAGDRPARP
jgi:glycosyltransferase involved in cell wall biosynthesis